MNIQALRSDHIYRKVMQVPLAEKTELYREEMLAPFMKKWETQQVPYKAADPGGFDVMTINNFIFRAPEEMTPEISTELELISSDAFWQECEAVVARSLGLFTENGVKLKVSEYLFTILLGNPKSQSLLLNEGYSGDGGIPGYILCTLLPNAYTLPRMKPALAHEVNHNVRYQYIQWDHTVTLGELIVSEGLAENFATLLYGEELLGPWVSKTSAETLNRQIKPVLKEQLDVTGFDQIAPYLYGDELAKLQNFTPVGMPYSAGYACGYYLVQYYLKQTGKSIVEATITPAAQILDEVRGYWNETTIISD
ncbi:DUF2268 domain-containing protein [Bacillus sp. FSL R5-0394]|uniref:DUF2268 domain-containing protein n=1 Tax=Shouchella TaxID=2893057 RepID=UPI000BA707AD|nr:MULTISPECIES: DUF2268 domain-containing protein [Shouchella]MCM3380945.1 DUF2268 domain-containing protein [Shouchella rhizosphaerae]PAF09849.1 Zn-dependent protease [Shouchella clausii]